MSVKDFRIVAKVINNQLRERRECLGLSAPDLAEQAGVTYSDYIALEMMRMKPVGRSGRGRGPLTWRKSAMRLAEFFRVSVDDLFPSSILAVEKSESEIRVNAEEVAAAMSLPGDGNPLLALSDGGAHNGLYEAIQALEPKEREILALRYGLVDGQERTHREIGEAIGKSHSRVAQLESRALRKLRKLTSDGLEVVDV